MKSILILIGIIAGGFLIQQFLPWWSISALAALIAAWSGFSAGKDFLLGFFGAFLLWAGYAFWLNMGNDAILATKMGGLFGGLGPVLMILVTGLLGGLLGGLGAAIGSLGRRMLG